MADYFAMRDMYFRDEPFVKARHNAALQEQTRRSRQSIDFKYRNISAVLEELSSPWLPGYAPARHFQTPLLNAVEDFIARDSDRVLVAPEPIFEVAETASVYVGPPPPLEQSPRKRPDALERLIRKFDPAARDDRNRTLGKKGEERVFHAERQRLILIGREDLAKKVQWVSEELGDGAGYDIRSFSTQGKERFLEVKTTGGHQRTPFFLSRNERDFAEERPDGFRIFRLYEFGKEPKAFLIKPPLESQLILEPANYKASFG